MTTQLEDSQSRLAWRTNSKVQIYSNSRNQWFLGTIVRIFTDEEGEWLEIRYDNTMSKQVQRYSSDIRAVKPEQIQPNTTSASPLPSHKSGPPTNNQENELPFPPEEMQVRQMWTTNDLVEIYSNTNKEWYEGKISEIVRDDEGEWLNVMWEKKNKEAMSKQVQRFSTDIRPKKKKNNQPNNVQKSSITSKKNSTSGLQTGRRAPRFSKSIPSSTHTYPATSQFRRIKKLGDVVENDDEDEFESESINNWSNKDVLDWLASLGRSYMRYNNNFQSIDGVRLVQLNEDSLTALKIPKLHRCKILLELSRHIDPDHSEILSKTKEMSVLGWDSSQVAKWIQNLPLPLSSYANVFKDNGVDGILLFEIDEEDLSDMGVRQTERKKLLDAIKKFSNTMFGSPSPQPPSVDLQIPNGDTTTFTDDYKQQKKNSARRGSVIMLPEIENIPKSETKASPEIIEIIQDMAKIVSEVANTYANNLKQRVKELQRKTDALTKFGNVKTNSGHKRRASLPLIEQQNNLHPNIMSPIVEYNYSDDEDLSDID